MARYVHPPVRRGADHPAAVFTPEQVRALRRDYERNPRPLRAIARELRCAESTVRRALRGWSYEEEG